MPWLLQQSLPQRLPVGQLQNAREEAAALKVGEKGKKGLQENSCCHFLMTSSRALGAPPTAGWGRKHGYHYPPFQIKNKRHREWRVEGTCPDSQSSLVVEAGLEQEARLTTRPATIAVRPLHLGPLTLQPLCLSQMDCLLEDCKSS